MKIGELLRKLWSLRSCFRILPPGALTPRGIEGAMKSDVSKHWCTLQWCASRGWVIAHENWTSCLPSVRDLYIKELERNGSPNPNYRGNKLLGCLQDDPQVLERWAFSKVSPGNKGCLSFWLIYRADITIADAMARVYKLASGDNLKDVAQQLRSVILRAYKAEKDMPWPPTVHDIPEPGLPHDLQRFLSFIFDGHGELQLRKCCKFAKSSGKRSI